MSEPPLISESVDSVDIPQADEELVLSEQSGEELYVFHASLRR